MLHDKVVLVHDRRLTLSLTIVVLAFGLQVDASLDAMELLHGRLQLMVSLKIDQTVSHPFN